MKKEYDLTKLKRKDKITRTDKSVLKTSISIRLDTNLLIDIKSKAREKGIPYQTFISSILFQYINGSLLDKDLVDQIKKIAS